jgi:hypothetical protein
MATSRRRRYRGIHHGCGGALLHVLVLYELVGAALFCSIPLVVVVQYATSYSWPLRG